MPRIIFLEIKVLVHLTIYSVYNIKKPTRSLGSPALLTDLPSRTTPEFCDMRGLTGKPAGPMIGLMTQGLYEAKVDPVCLATPLPW